MKAAKFLLSAAATAGMAATAAAQFPLQAAQQAAAPPIATAPPPPLPTGIAPQPANPGGPTIWDKLGVSKAQREACRRQLCRTPFGQLMGRIRTPFTRISGGLIPPFCPLTPSLAELMDPGVIGAAAKVKQDKAGAAQRIEAIQLLATVDCTYWPEAEEALIGALRTDRNECVRYEAALALGRGCCCTCKVIVALSHTVCCSDKDGGFMEKSARVRSAAAVALERCLASNCCVPELPPAGPVIVPVPNGGPKEGGPEGGTPESKPETTASARIVAVAQAKPGPDARPKPAGPMTFAEYYQAVPKLPMKQVIDNARRALEMGQQIGLGVGVDVIPADYEAAYGVSPASARRPANLWTMMTRTGPTPSPAVMAVTDMTMVTPASVVTPASKPVVTPAPAPAPLPAKTTVTKTAVPVEPVMKAPTPAPKPSMPATPGVSKVMPAAPKAPAPLPPLKTESKPAVAKVTPVMPATPPAPVQPASVAAKPAPAKMTPPAKPALPPVTTAEAKVMPPVVVPVVPTMPPQPVNVQPVTPTPAAKPAPAAVDEVPADPVPLNLPRSVPGYTYPPAGYHQGTWRQ